MGERIEYMVYFGEQEEIMLFSDNDTVERMKIEIEGRYNIPPDQQKIQGWHKNPESDDTFLKDCLNPNAFINCVKVSSESPTALLGESSRTDINNATSNDEVEDNFVTNDEKAVEDEVQQLQSIISLQSKLKLKSIKLNYSPLNDALQSSFQNKVVLLLYLHNGSDPFGRLFSESLRKPEFQTVIEKSFFFLGWDVEEPVYHNALASALNSHENLAIISEFVYCKVATVVFATKIEDTVHVLASLKGEMSYGNLVNSLKQLQTVYLDEPLKEEDLQLRSIYSLEEKLKPNKINLQHSTLDDALRVVSPEELDKRKILLLYFHNSSDRSCRSFIEMLSRPTIGQILNKSYVLLGWDVERTEFHDGLIGALNRHVNLRDMANLVRRKVSIGFCIIPVEDTIRVVTGLKNSLSYTELLNSLKQTQTVLNNEIADEKQLCVLASKTSTGKGVGVEEFQTMMAEQLGDRDYDRFEYDEHKELRNKIGFALKGAPESEYGYDAETNKKIEQLYKVIARESNEVSKCESRIEMACVYNCTQPLPKERLIRYIKDLDYDPYTDIRPVPIFILRKCRESQCPCRIFVDDSGRVYKSWTAYLTENKLPKCEMTVPFNGRYKIENGKVLLEKHLSPACHISTKALQVGDIVGAVAGIGSGAIFAAAAVPAITVAPAVLVGGAVVGGIVGIYSMVRSSLAIHDRRIHKETMSFANSEARGAYLNLVAGSLGILGSGATTLVAQMASRGFTIGRMGLATVDTVNILNMGASGVSVCNSGYEVISQWISENKKPSAMTVLQLSSSIFFFAHAVYNYKSASTTFQENQQKVLLEYEGMLRSNRHRKTFNKLTKQTIKEQNSVTRGRAEVIKVIQKIPNKDEVFASLTRNNKAMNKQGIKFSADNGQIKLNGVAVNMNEFGNLSKKQTEMFLNNLSQQSPEPVVQSGSTLETSIKSYLGGVEIGPVSLQTMVVGAAKIVAFASDNIKEMIINIAHKVLIKLAKPIMDVLDEFLKNVRKEIKVLQYVVKHFSTIVDEWEQKYQDWLRTKDPQYYESLFDYVSPIYTKRIMKVLEITVKLCSSGADHALKKIIENVTTWIFNEYYLDQEKKRRQEELNAHYSSTYPRVSVKCKVCYGVYYKRNS